MALELLIKSRKARSRSHGRSWLSNSYTKEIVVLVQKSKYKILDLDRCHTSQAQRMIKLTKDFVQSKKKHIRSSSELVPATRIRFLRVKVNLLKLNPFAQNQKLLE